MKVEVTLERQRGKVWAVHARGKFTGDMDKLGRDIERWLVQNGAQASQDRAVGWGFSFRVTA